MGMGTRGQGLVLGLGLVLLGACGDDGSPSETNAGPTTTAGSGDLTGGTAGEETTEGDTSPAARPN